MYSLSPKRLVLRSSTIQGSIFSFHRRDEELEKFEKSLNLFKQFFFHAILAVTALPKVDARPKSLDPTSISTLFAITTRVFNHQEIDTFFQKLTIQKSTIFEKCTATTSGNIVFIIVTKF